MKRTMAIGLMLLMLAACGRSPGAAPVPEAKPTPAAPVEQPPAVKPQTPEPAPVKTGDFTYSCTTSVSGAWGPVDLPPVPAQWEYLYPKPTGLQLNGVAFGKGLFVAVGDVGTILTSPDGEQWTVAVSGQSVGLSGVAYGAGRFVAVGQDGTLYGSPDGKNWTKRALPAGGELREIAFGNGRFVVLNTMGVAWTSSDGQAWTSCTGTATALTRLTYQGALFAAFGPGGGKEQPPKTLYTSKDGLQWNAGAQVQSPGGLPAFVHGNGKYLALVSHDQGAVSTDGSAWSPLSLSYTFGGGHNGYVGGAYGNGRFMAPITLCDPGGCGTQLLTSTDGSKWEGQLWSDNPLKGIAFGNGRFVGVGERGKIVTSDGTKMLWESVTTWMPISQIAYGGGRFVAMGGWGAILLSEDGRTWNYPPKGAKQPGITSELMLYHDGKQFVATGIQKHTGPVVYTSPDGKDWAMVKEAPPAPEHKVLMVNIPGKRAVSAAEGEGRLVAVTEDGEIWGHK